MATLLFDQELLVGEIKGMGFYSRRIFPRLLDLTMAGEEMARYRRQLLQSVSGEVLEIGFGTGLNLPHYPDTVTRLTAIEPNQGMESLATNRLQNAPFDVAFMLGRAEALPFENECFDSAVCTWTLCSIPEIDRALKEVYRVLKPGGRFFFIEHGLSSEPGIATWQQRLTPLQRRIADGCHLNRSMGQLVAQVFPQVKVETFYAQDLPKLLGYFYRGTATK